MSEVLGGRAARLVWLIAWLWVCVIAPLELATTLTGWLAGPTRGLGAAGVVLITARILVVAVGLIVGRQLPQPQLSTRGLALRWACADLVTLAIILATEALPSNRFPGMAPFVWVGYAVLDSLVVLAARRRPA